MSKFNLLFIVLFFSTFAFSQTSDTGNWLMYFGNNKISKNWNWHNEIQYRNYNFIGDTNQILLRTGFGYNFTENNNNLLLGYAFVTTQNYIVTTQDKLHINEHRIFQQFITKQNFGRIFLQHRYRLEERFINDNCTIRFRYLVGLNIPINKKTMDKNAIYLSFYNELFINGKTPLFDRNRLYGALGYVINKNVKVETGFMAQTLENFNRNQFQIAIHNTLPF